MEREIEGERLKEFCESYHFLNHKKKAESKTERMILATIQVTMGKRNSNSFFWT
jgi:hypothetical protein